jgi:UPF0176 protein
MTSRYEVITFYEFRPIAEAELRAVRESLLDAMSRHEVLGTIIIATEGYNATVSGSPESLRSFAALANAILGTEIRLKSSYHDDLPFKRAKVKIKREIVTLGHPVDVSLGVGTHVDPVEWNEVIRRDDVFVLDTRNDYEYKTGTFTRAVNPETEKFSDLPAFVEENLDPERHRAIAMFCTGGIRCEKFAPYMRAKGFDTVYQLQGGILNYLEKVPKEEQLWVGECFVFDERISVDAELTKGTASDLSLPGNGESE